MVYKNKDIIEIVSSNFWNRITQGSSHQFFKFNRFYIMFIGDQNKSLPRRVERKSEHDHRWVTNDESQCTYVTSILGYTRIHHPQGHMFHVNYSHTVKHSSDQNVLGDKGTDNYYPSIQNYIWKERKTNIYCSTMTSFIIWLYQQCHDKTPDIFQFVQVYCQINYGHHSQVISCIYTRLLCV